MKLTTKIFIALVLLVVLILIGQAIISDQVISDRFRLESVSDPESKYKVLKNSGSVREYPCNPFRYIRINDNMKVSFLKAEKSGIFMNKYVSGRMNFSFSGDTLVIGSNSDYTRDYIYVFMQEEPLLVVINSTSYSQVDFSGFEGENMKFVGRNGSAYIEGDLKYVNIDQDSGYISYRAKRKDTAVKIGDMQLNVQARNGTFNYYTYDSNIETMSANIILDNAVLEFNQCYEPSPFLKKLEVSGQIASNAEKSFFGNICINQCDSLIIHLSGDSIYYSNMRLETFSVKYEDIQIPEGMNLERRNRRSTEDSSGY